jgi:hypothetical protein
MPLPRRLTSHSITASTVFRLALSCALPSTFAVSSAYGTLIASEAFKATGSGTGGTYDADVNLGLSPNLSVVTGNFGFDSVVGKRWVNSTAGAQVNLSGLSHSFVPGTLEAGGVRLGNLTANISRRSYRPFASLPPTADTYFFSGLVNLPTQTSLNGVSQSFAGLTVSAGTTQDTFNIASGIHYGLTKNSSNEIYLSVAAGNTIYPLQQITGTDVTFQVVLRLDVSTTGAETLSAWYASTSDSQLSVGLTSIDVGDIYSSSASLGAMIVQTRNQSANNNSGRTVLFDELRFGTSASDVTLATIPEPAQASLWCGAGAALVLSTRRRSRPANATPA